MNAREVAHGFGLVGPRLHSLVEGHRDRSQDPENDRNDQQLKKCEPSGGVKNVVFLPYRAQGGLTLME